MQGFSLNVEASKPKSENPKLRKSLADSDSEDENDLHGKEVQVTGFNRSQGGAVLKHKKETPKAELPVIKPLSNENWRQVVRNRVYHPPASQPADVKENDDNLEYGLNRRENTIKDEDEEQEELPMLTESQAYQKDVESRPDAPTMEDYSRIPVEAFGAALLRGMGRNPSDDEKDDLEEATKLRPSLLGLGAKEQPSGNNEEMGAWGKAASKKQTSADKSYTPVAKVSKVTGKRINDDDLESKRKRSRDDDYHSRHRSRRHDDHYRKSRRRDDDSRHRRDDDFKYRRDRYRDKERESDRDRDSSRRSRR